MASIDGLIDELARPLYVYRMGSNWRTGNQGQRKSSLTRQQNARAEIETMIRQWVEQNPVDAGDQ